MMVPPIGFILSIALAAQASNPPIQVETPKEPEADPAAGASSSLELGSDSTSVEAVSPETDVASESNETKALKAPETPATMPNKKSGETSGEKDRCQVVIMNLSMLGVSDDQQYVAQILTDTLAAEVNSLGTCEVITQADVAQMLDFEAAKAIACTDDTASCVAEIGGALGVERVISGSIGLLGSSYKVQIKLHNVAKGRVEARYDKLVRGEPELLDEAAREAGRALFQVPVAKPAERVASSSGEAIVAKEITEADDAPSTAKEEQSKMPEAEVEESSGWLSSTLAVAGGIGIVAGLIGVGASGLILGFSYYAVETTGGMNVVPPDYKPAAAPAAFLSVAGIALGLGVMGLGAGFGAVSLVVE